MGTQCARAVADAQAGRRFASSTRGVMSVILKHYLDLAQLKRHFALDTRLFCSEHDLARHLANCIQVHLKETKISRVHLEFSTSCFQRRSYCDQPSSRIDVAVLPTSFVDEFRKVGWIDWSNKTKTDLKADLFLEVKNLLLPGYIKSQPGFCRTGVEKDIQKLRNCLACEWTKSAVVFGSRPSRWCLKATVPSSRHLTLLRSVRPFPPPIVAVPVWA